MVLVALNPLTCWKTPEREGSELAEVCEALLRVAIERHGEEVLGVLDVAASPDAEEAFLIAGNPVYAGIDQDEARAWLWVAACAGHALAAEQLAATLELEALKSADSPVNAEQLRTRAGEWRERARVERAATPSTDHGRRTVLLDDVEDPDSILKAADGVAGARVVVSGVGDAKSREGADLMRRYAEVIGAAMPALGAVPSIGVASSAILERWPWAVEAAGEIEAQLAVLRSAEGAVRLRPLLFVGPPGSGKSTLAVFVCRLLGLHQVVLPCAGVADAGGLAAVTRGWATSRPGAIFSAMHAGMTCNPAIVVDEIEKSSVVGSHNGSVMGALLEMVGASSYYDTCLMAPVDLAAVTFIATANGTGRLDDALLDRFTVVQVPRPRPEDFDVVCATVRADFVVENRIHEGFVPRLGGLEMDLMRRFYERTPSVRSFKARYERVVRALMLDEQNAVASEPRMLN